MHAIRFETGTSFKRVRSTESSTAKHSFPFLDFPIMPEIMTRVPQVFHLAVSCMCGESFTNEECHTLDGEVFFSTMFQTDSSVFECSEAN